MVGIGERQETGPGGGGEAPLEVAREGVEVVAVQIGRLEGCEAPKSVLSGQIQPNFKSVGWAAETSLGQIHGTLRCYVL